MDIAGSYGSSPRGAFHFRLLHIIWGSGFGEKREKKAVRLVRLSVFPSEKPKLKPKPNRAYIMLLYATRIAPLPKHAAASNLWFLRTSNVSTTRYSIQNILNANHTKELLGSSLHIFPSGLGTGTGSVKPQQYKSVNTTNKQTNKQTANHTSHTIR